MPRRKKQTQALQTQRGKIAFPIDPPRVGRPSIEIDKIQFETLCGIQCTKVEICAVLRVSDKTLDRWCLAEYAASFSVVFDEKRAEGRASLRRLQFQKATAGDTKMLIWLGVNWLGQSQQPAIDKEDKDVVIRVVREDEETFEDDDEFGSDTAESGDTDQGENLENEGSE